MRVINASISYGNTLHLLQDGAIYDVAAPWGLDKPALAVAVFLSL